MTGGPHRTPGDVIPDFNPPPPEPPPPRKPMGAVPYCLLVGWAGLLFGLVIFRMGIARSMEWESYVLLFGVAATAVTLIWVKISTSCP